MTEQKFCTTCKHFEHRSNVAHQSRCKRFPDEAGDSIPCVVAKAEKCNKDQGWEPL